MRKSAVPLDPGQQISHYRIVEKIGEGGMGVVYRAVDTKLDREVAIKMLSPEITQDPKGLARFRREARTLAALNHPNIVTIHSVEEADGLPFLTMELIDGEPLRRRLRPGGLTAEAFLELALPLTEALAVAHERGVTHRDLKPSNVMINRDGRLKVLDFGLSRAGPARSEAEASQPPTETLTQAGLAAGTIPYMSPEHVEGRVVDHRSDIFSLGIVLHEMATGERPFAGNSPASTMAAILRDDPRPVTESNAALPRGLARVIQRCLQKDPVRRYQSARDLYNDLDELRGESLEGESLPSVAVLPFVDMSPDKDQEHFCQGIAEELINALTKVGSLRVASRTSAFRFRDRGEDLRELGRALGVGAVLDGSVRKAAERLRVTAQLVKVSDGYPLWSERFDRELRDVFAVQDEIAQRIVEALEVTLSPRERRAMKSSATADPRAYDFYLRGRRFFYRLNRGNLEFARQMFSRAIELDPDYALAHAGLADCCSFLHLYLDPSAQTREEADRASRRALELDPDLAEAHASRGQALTILQDFEGAERHLRRAEQLDPRLFEAQYFQGRLCFAQGRLEEAAEFFRRASELRPDDYQTPLLMAGTLKGLRREREAAAAHKRGLEIAERHLDLNPDDARALYLGAGALVQLGEVARGLEWLDRALAMAPEDPHVRYNAACVLTQAGETERALECLEEAGPILRLDSYLRWIEHDGDLDPLRDHPRFQAFLEELRRHAG